MELANLRIESRIRLAALVVIVDHLFDGLQAAVVHVGRRTSGFPQTGRLKSAAIPLLLSHNESALIARPPDPCVVKALIGEVRPQVATGTAGLGPEQPQAETLLRRERIAVPLQIPI